MRILTTVFALLCLGACAGSRTADLDIGEDSYFVARLPAASIVAPGRIQFIMARLNPETGRATDWEYDIPRDEGGKRWHVIAVSPGDYVIMSVGVNQGSATWSVCHAAATYRYSIGENEAVYLGEIDPARNILELSRQVVAERQTRASAGSFLFVHQNISTPGVPNGAPSTGELAAAQAALSAREQEAPTNMQWRAGAPAAFSNAEGLRLVTCGG
jgi:hypothetical protein